MPPESPDIAIAHEYRRVAQSTPTGVVEHLATVIREKDGDQDFVVMFLTGVDPMIAQHQKLTWGKFTLTALFPSFPHVVVHPSESLEVTGWIVECRSTVS